MPSASNTSCIKLCRVQGDSVAVDRDKVAVEEPLEIQIGFERKGVGAIRSISVTMRTPGNDEELATGFLFGEGLLNRRSELARIERNESNSTNSVRIHLAAGVRFDFKHLERHFYTTSSCGICGKATLEAVQRLLLNVPRANSSLRLSVATVHSLPSQLKRAQYVFADTGGCTPPRCSTHTVIFLRSERMSDGITRSTSLLAPRGSMDAFRLRTASFS